MKKITIILLLIIASITVKAQFSISYSVGYGSYKMDKMKETMDLIMQMLAPGTETPLHTKLIDNFPAYVMHTVDAGYKISKHETGLKFSFMTTGGKVAAADYSGTYELKLITNGYRIGAFYRNYFYDKDIKQHNLSFFAEFSPALTIAELKFDEKVVIHNSDDTKYTAISDKESQTKTGFSIQPLAGVRFGLYRRFLLSASVGYDFEFGANLGNSNRMDFSGFRMNAGIGYVF